MITALVAEITQVTPDIKVFRLQRSDGRLFEPYEAGAHIDVTCPNGMIRQYSLCGPPWDQRSYWIAVKREADSRGGSASLHKQLAVGSQVEISAPRNLFRLESEADRHILVAAGIGITPLLSMAYQLHAARHEFVMHYFARSVQEAAFVADIERSAFAARMVKHFGVAREAQPKHLSDLLAAADARTHVYTCGPKGFIQKVLETAAGRLHEDQLHVEYFQPLEPAAQAGDAFDLELDTGEVYRIPPGSGIVDVLADDGIEIDTSCREGICGTCVLSVLDGVPDHRDNCLTRKEKQAGDQIAACVSRAKTSRLIVEI